MIGRHSAEEQETVGQMLSLEDIVTRDPEILGGTPVFTGTRVPVDTLIVHLKSGKSLEEILDDFPSVRREQALAFLDYAEAALLGDSRAA